MTTPRYRSAPMPRADGSTTRRDRDRHAPDRSLGAARRSAAWRGRPARGRPGRAPRPCTFGEDSHRSIRTSRSCRRKRQLAGGARRASGRRRRPADGTRGARVVDDCGGRLRLEAETTRGEIAPDEAGREAELGAQLERPVGEAGARRRAVGDRAVGLEVRPRVERDARRAARQRHRVVPREERHARRERVDAARRRRRPPITTNGH